MGGLWNMMGQLVENGETEDWERKLESVTSLELASKTVHWKISGIRKVILAKTLSKGENGD